MKNKTSQVFTLAKSKSWVMPILTLSAIVFGIAGVAVADNVVQGFQGKGNVAPGWVVALTKTNPQVVEAAPASDSSRIYGVVVDPSDAPLTLNRGLGNQVFVATSGNYDVLVSTDHGKIKPGDYLSISSTDGIAALSTADKKTIVGQAIDSFDGKKNVITNAGGYSIGKIMVNISPRKNPLVKNDVAIPGFLRKLGESIAGKPVSGLKIYISLAFLIAATVLSMTLLYAGVRGGMIAMGRNPLNRGHIMNSMFKVVTAASMVFIIGLFGVYLLLRI
jgi:hypothetical protein